MRRDAQAFRRLLEADAIDLNHALREAMRDAEAGGARSVDADPLVRKLLACRMSRDDETAAYP